MRKRKMGNTWLAGPVMAVSSLLVGGCDEELPPGPPEDAIVIGAALPFSGPNASAGIHLERALRLAVEDVNRVGGVAGRPLFLKIVDTNSGSTRGLNQVVQLFADPEVAVVVGPDEAALQTNLLKKTHEKKLQLIPSMTAPVIRKNEKLWVNLAPSRAVLGCAYSEKLKADGIASTRSFVESDEFHSEMYTFFNSFYVQKTAELPDGGKAYFPVKVASDATSYKSSITSINKQTSDAILMFAYPRTAANLLRAMKGSDQVRWYFSPMLRDDGFLWNVPAGDVTGDEGLSASFASNEECGVEDSLGGAGGAAGEVTCTADAADRFDEHYAARWGGQPLRAGHYYYDSVLVLALAMERVAAAGGDETNATSLFGAITEHVEGAEEAPWHEIDRALELARAGTPFHFHGSAGEYEYDKRGNNQRLIVDVWSIDGKQKFVERESVVCSQPVSED